MNTKEHLKFEHFQTWIADTEAVYASRTTKDGFRLKLIVRLNGNFVVKLGTAVAYEGLQPFSAIEKFNELV